MAVRRLEAVPVVGCVRFNCSRLRRSGKARRASAGGGWCFTAAENGGQSHIRPRTAWWESRWIPRRGAQS